jgi:hypothetical protein
MAGGFKNATASSPTATQTTEIVMMRSDRLDVVLSLQNDRATLRKDATERRRGDRLHRHRPVYGRGRIRLGRADTPAGNRRGFDGWVQPVDRRQRVAAQAETAIGVGGATEGGLDFISGTGCGV